MEIINSTLEDIATIFELYDAAIAHQKAVSHLHWLPFDQEMVKAEILSQRQWKILLDGQIACVFATAYSDPEIWGEKEADPAVYLHRIVTNPSFRGRNLIAEIVRWSKTHGAAKGKRFVRLDTWSDNLKLKEVYLSAGFNFLGIISPSNPAALPSHYSGIQLGLFELEID